MALKLGLTGGIGSGKSTVAALFSDLGAYLLDADAQARELTATNGLAVAQVRATFGVDFITPDGAMDRGRMRELVYADRHARAKLEAIVHPLVWQQTWRQAQAAQAAGQRCLIFDVPLLVESTRWRQRLDRVLLVDCSVERQIQRVVARSQMTPGAVQAIVAVQADRLSRLAAADAVLFNDALTLDELKAQVHALAAGLGLSLRQL